MEVINTIGRRKSAVARIYLSEGTGKITINKKDITEYPPVFRCGLDALGHRVLLFSVLPVPQERWEKERGRCNCSIT